MRKKGNTVLAGLIICLLLVFLAAAGKLFGAYLKYQKGDVSYEKLQEYVQEPEEEESPESEKEKEEPKNRYLEIDFAGLKAVNPDVIAWIQIPALDISYPVVQGKDNAYYLHHLFSGESNINGSIFVDCHNQPDFTDQNTIVYGHNMKNGSMFGTLDAVLKILEIYKPLLIKNAIVNGRFDEDLYQELVSTLLQCIQRFQIIE